MLSKRYVIAAMAVVGLAGVGLYETGVFRFNYPSTREFPVRGIDVSHHQGQVSWFESSLHDVKFAYFKATEGTDFSDRQFLYNWNVCEKSGLACGAYHFFNFCQPGALQARHFLNTLPPGPMSLPPALDLEFSGNCKRAPTQQAMVREVSAFVQGIAKRYPGPPVFYVTPDIYKRYFEGHRGDFPAHQLWIRSILHPPKQKPCTEWTFWQYADHARIQGIQGGTVDLDAFCGTAEQFTQFIKTGRI